MKTRTESHYELYVVRDGRAMAYSATPYASVADARVAAKRLGEYAEIRKVTTTVKAALIERVEA